MYNVQTMSNRYTVSTVRERLSDALDQADRGEAVIIERRRVRYRLTREIEKPVQSRRPKSRIKILDPALLTGEWHWEYVPGKDLVFKAGAKKRGSRHT